MSEACQLLNPSFRPGWMKIIALLSYGFIEYFIMFNLNTTYLVNMSDLEKFIFQSRWMKIIALKQTIFFPDKSCKNEIRFIEDSQDFALQQSQCQIDGTFHQHSPQMWTSIHTNVIDQLV